jgi:hypothetical protein
MSYRVIIKQVPDADTVNHFKYEFVAAYSTNLDSNVLDTAFNHIIQSLTKDSIIGDRHFISNSMPHFVFNLENVEGCFDESVIGRVVTTRQLVDILKTDEFVEDSAECSLLLGGVTVTHHLIIQFGVLYDIGLEDVDIQWAPEGFIEHYQHSLWRIHS